MFNLKKKAVRNSVKAVIVRDNKVLTIRNSAYEADYYILPGGGQKHSETLHETLIRECNEEIGTTVEIGDLIFLREYIGSNHEFADEDCGVHQLELMFRCDVPEEYEAHNGVKPDEQQTGVMWLPIDSLEKFKLYPSFLKEELKKIDAITKTRYFGDSN